MFEIRQLSSDEAKELAITEWWKHSNPISISTFQLTQEFLCCPFELYKESLSRVLDRTVFQYELAKPDLLIAEIKGNKETPSLFDLLDLFAQLSAPDPFFKPDLDSTLSLNGRISQSLTRLERLNFEYYYARHIKFNLKISIIDGVINISKRN